MSALADQCFTMKENAMPIGFTTSSNKVTRPKTMLLTLTRLRMIDHTTEERKRDYSASEKK